MHHIADFFEWLFSFSTNALMPVMFILGIAFLVICVAAVAFVLSPVFGVGFILSVLFGVPILAYLAKKSREEK